MSVGLTVNDLKSQAWKRKIAGVGDDEDVTSGKACRVMAISLAVDGTAGGGHFIAYNAITATGTDLIQINGAQNEGAFMRLGQNGTRFDTGLSVAATNADNAVVYYVEEATS
jgi:hypothetical protein